jgi:hypothetical protein
MRSKLLACLLAIVAGAVSSTALAGAASLRIEGGYWLFCTDAHFQGTCRTFGPGQYAQLPWDVSNKISSGRRIHEQYPYNAPPAWQR